MGKPHLGEAKKLFEQLMIDLAGGLTTDTEFVRDIIRPQFGAARSPPSSHSR